MGKGGKGRSFFIPSSNDCCYKFSGGYSPQAFGTHTDLGGTVFVKISPQLVLLSTSLYFSMVIVVRNNLKMRRHFLKNINTY